MVRGGSWATGLNGRRRGRQRAAVDRGGNGLIEVGAQTEEDEGGARCSATPRASLWVRDAGGPPRGLQEGLRRRRVVRMGAFEPMAISDDDLRRHADRARSGSVRQNEADQEAGTPR